MASLEWSVDELAKFLDAYPNATVDLAARMTQVQYQSKSDREKVRSFFIRYQDRLLYGTDLTENPPSAEERAQNPPIDMRLMPSGAQTGSIWQPPRRNASMRSTRALRGSRCPRASLIRSTTGTRDGFFGSSGAWIQAAR
jgi:hypothetical protein